MDNLTLQIFIIVILIISAVAHEYMHGWAANQMGDPTAKDAGRLTLNPLAHLDLFGSFLFPAMMILLNTGFFLAWAKPVPFNPYNLRDQKFGSAKVALAGPLSNFVIAIFFGLLIRFFDPAILAFNPNLSNLLSFIVFINILLMVFNLIPIPPMDGSKIIAPFLPVNWQIRYMELERFGMMLVLFFVIFGFHLIIPIIDKIFKIIVGSDF